jgi:hypothetical protein
MPAVAEPPRYHCRDCKLRAPQKGLVPYEVYICRLLTTHLPPYDVPSGNSGPILMTHAADVALSEDLARAGAAGSATSPLNVA